jgi:hypothetical protein
LMSFCSRARPGPKGFAFSKPRPFVCGAGTTQALS